ncbi:hypothetical protein [Nocardia terpenica]|uniref:hypothetical protein n=1 Tax=Nocardia terpenica TaxID=455432 RepID=UPI0002EA07DF|nr:hypothetical protein [Nocardia terpenica]NQE91539.1 hypothetical protein [Nocardia terpenica]
MMKLLAVVALTAMTVICVAQPAAAEPLRDCQAGVPGASVGPITVAGNSVFTGSVLADVRPNDVFRVDWISGQVKIGEWPWDPSYGTAGAGWGNLADNRYYPVPGVPKYSLVGKVRRQRTGRLPRPRGMLPIPRERIHVPVVDDERRQQR